MRRESHLSLPQAGRGSDLARDLIVSWPRLKVYCARALARPAWQRTLSLCAERQGVSVAEIL